LLLLVLIGLRFFNRWVTLVAFGWMSVSPMDLAIAQRAWQDGVLALVALLLVYVCAEISYKRRRVSWFILLGVLGSFCVLIKETGIIIYGLCIIWVLWVTFVKEKSLGRSLFVIIFSLCSIGISIFLISKACGGFLNVTDAIRHNIGSLTRSEYALIYNSGPWFRILQGFFFLSPVAAILSLVGIIGIILPGKGENAFLGRRRVILGIIFFTLSFTVISLFPQNLRNLRFFSVVFIPFYLMAGTGSYYIVRFLKGRVRAPLFYLGAAAIILGISAAGFFDYQNFKALFVVKETPDLAVKLLIEHSLYNFF
ncbi:MAG: glycosyltransferase family 39 protein, partial [Candidatus Omnitrophota bacterium]